MWNFTSKVPDFTPRVVLKMAISAWVSVLPPSLTPNVKFPLNAAPPSPACRPRPVPLTAAPPAPPPPAPPRPAPPRPRAPAPAPAPPRPRAPAPPAGRVRFAHPPCPVLSQPYAGSISAPSSSTPLIMVKNFSLQDPCRSATMTNSTRYCAELIFNNYIL